MPVFDYGCSCGETKTNDVFVSAGVPDVALPPCAVCGGEQLKRFATFGFKVWHYEPWRMDAAADARRAGVEWD